MWDPNQAEENFSPIFPAALHSGVRQLMSRTLDDAIHIHYKIKVL